MSNRYFVWKNPKCNGINPEWIELRPREYYAFVKCPLNKGRYFIDFNADSQEDTDVLMMEVTAEEYAEWDRRRHQYRYRRDIEMEYEDYVVSLEEKVAEDDEMLFSEVIADINADTENEVIHRMDLVQLKAALDKLTPEELALINALFHDNLESRGERSIAADLGVPRMTLNDRKRKILRKIKNSSVQNEKNSPSIE